MKTYNIQLIILAFMTISFSGKVDGQSILQKKTILQNEMFYSLESNTKSSLLSLSISSMDNDKDLYDTPAPNRTMLKNNPLPWYTDGDKFYYLSMDMFFKGSYTLRINAIEVSELLNRKKKLELKFLDSNPYQSYYLKDIHNRKFSGDDIDNLYFDFTVSKNGQISLVSYSENKVCAYQTYLINDSFEFCGCSELNINPPFQIIEKEEGLTILDATNNLIKAEKDSNGDFYFKVIGDKYDQVKSGDKIIIKN